MADAPRPPTLLRTASAPAAPGDAETAGQGAGQHTDHPPPMTDLDARIPASRGIGPGETIAAVLSLGWMAAVGLFFVFMPGGEAGFDPLRFVLVLMAIFLPVAMIWVAAASARSARIMRDEARRLHAAIEGMRRTYLEDRQKSAFSGAGSASMERKLTEIARAAQKTESALATFATRRAETFHAPAPVERETGDQPSLALGTQAEDRQPRLASADLIRALNFPDNEEDDEGFAALRRALRDRQARLLVQASQDVLTLLSQDGIYMDDLRPDRAKPDLWRRFAQGERGEAVAPLGGIRDRSCLALTSGRMREDQIFRDTAHHFLRRFDQMLAGFEPTASDDELAALAETRTARAFMLVGRVSGTFG